MVDATKLWRKKLPLLGGSAMCDVTRVLIILFFYIQSRIVLT
jgi:hypothetical protein